MDQSTIAQQERWRARASMFGLLLAGLVAAILSYSHQKELAIAAGQSHFQAWIWPGSVDGLMIACGGRLALDRLRNVTRGAWASVGFWGGFTVSVGANWLSVDALAFISNNPWVRHAIAASPALCLLLAAESVMAVARYAAPKVIPAAPGRRPLPARPQEIPTTSASRATGSGLVTPDDLVIPDLTEDERAAFLADESVTPGVRGPAMRGKPTQRVTRVIRRNPDLSAAEVAERAGVSEPFAARVIQERTGEYPLVGGKDRDVDRGSPFRRYAQNGASS